MSIRFLGSGGSGGDGCPSLYATADGYLVQGWVTGTPGTLEIPHLLLGFAEPDTFIGAMMTDTGRGTFTVSGRPVTDSEARSMLDFAEDEDAVLVPMTKRTFYGLATQC